jgi:hypothetical protein
MHVDAAALSRFTKRIQPTHYVRCTKLSYRSTPLGMGYGETRFASPTRAFQLIYIGVDLATSLAEAIVRDRFEAGGRRQLMDSEISVWGACEVTANTQLAVVDLRPRDACFQLGISTDITGAKCHDEARVFSQLIYDTTALDGILYASRLIGRDCVAVYDRAVTTKLGSGGVHELVRLANLIPSLRDDLGIELISGP